MLVYNITRHACKWPHLLISLGMAWSLPFLTKKGRGKKKIISLSCCKTEWKVKIFLKFVPSGQIKSLITLGTTFLFGLYHHFRPAQNIQVARKIGIAGQGTLTRNKSALALDFCGLSDGRKWAAKKDVNILDVFCLLPGVYISCLTTNNLYVARKYFFMNVHHKKYQITCHEEAATGLWSMALLDSWDDREWKQK